MFNYLGQPGQAGLDVIGAGRELPGGIQVRDASELEAALQEKPRPGAKPKITGEVEAYLTMIACSDPPEGKARWTMQMLADKLVEVKMLDSITDSAVCARLKKVRSNPGRSDATA